MATALGGDFVVNPARCLKHPQCSVDLFYCVDCNRVACGGCRREVSDRANHKKHLAIPLATHQQQRRECIAGIKADIKKYIYKHDGLRNDISVVLENAKKKELQSGYDIIEEFTSRLHQKVDTLKSSLQSTFEL